MESNRLTIQINKPVSDVFTFLLNPQNTPKWIDSITVEQTNEWPVKVGNQYKNQDKNGVWSEYTVSELKYDQMFVFTKKDGNYHVRYRFTPMGINETFLEYFEWVDNGQLEGPFTQKILEKLKQTIESNS